MSVHKVDRGEVTPIFGMDDSDEQIINNKSQIEQMAVINSIGHSEGIPAEEVKNYIIPCHQQLNCCGRSSRATKSHVPSYHYLTF